MQQRQAPFSPESFQQKWEPFRWLADSKPLYLLLQKYFFVSCCSSPGLSSPEWTLKVLLTYQALIGHNIKHIHLFKTFSVVLVSSKSYCRRQFFWRAQMTVLIREIYFRFQEGLISVWAAKVFPSLRSLDWCHATWIRCFDIEFLWLFCHTRSYRTLHSPAGHYSVVFS